MLKKALCLSLVLIAGLVHVTAASVQPPLPFAKPYGNGWPEFVVEPLSPEYRQAMTGLSWKAGSPVSLDDLCLVKVGYVGFDTRIMQGELVVHRQVAQEVSDIFRELLAAGYPMRRVSLVDWYGADDTLSMDADNTSAFNFRAVAGTSSLSKHSYGLAIDINPVENPFIKGSVVSPEAGKPYQDRALVLPGMIIPGDPCHLAFVRRGWTWGGDWKTMKDYQHFEKPIAILKD